MTSCRVVLHLTFAISLLHLTSHLTSTRNLTYHHSHTFACPHTPHTPETPSQQPPYIPYRNSKLTYLLRDCMGSPARTILIINVSAAVKNCNDTLSSLRFGCQSQLKMGYNHMSHIHEEGVSSVGQHRGNMSDRGGNISALGNMSMSMMTGHSNMWSKGMIDGEESRRTHVDDEKDVDYYQGLPQGHQQHMSHTTTTSHNTHHNTHHNTQYNTQHNTLYVDPFVNPPQHLADAHFQDHDDTSIPSISVLGLDRETVVVDGVVKERAHDDADDAQLILQNGRDRLLRGSPTTKSSSSLQQGHSQPSHPSSPPSSNPSSHPSPSHGTHNGLIVSPSATRRKGPFVISGTSVDASQISGSEQHTLSMYSINTPYQPTR